MVKVYFETPNGSYAELVAIFDSEELYLTCLPALELQAEKANFIITESVDEEKEINELN